jgi:hypothetical protein
LGSTLAISPSKRSCSLVAPLHMRGADIGRASFQSS